MEYKVCKNLAEAGDFYKQYTGVYSKRLTHPVVLVARDGGIKAAICVFIIDDPFYARKIAIVTHLEGDDDAKEGLKKYAVQYTREADCGLTFHYTMSGE